MICNISSLFYSIINLYRRWVFLDGPATIPLYFTIVIDILLICLIKLKTYRLRDAIFLRKKNKGCKTCRSDGGLVGSKIIRLITNTILQVLHRYIPPMSVETTNHSISLTDNKEASYIR